VQSALQRLKFLCLWWAAAGGSVSSDATAEISPQQARRCHKHVVVADGKCGRRRWWRRWNDDTAAVVLDYCVDDVRQRRRWRCSGANITDAGATNGGIHGGVVHWTIGGGGETKGRRGFFRTPSPAWKVKTVSRWFEKTGCSLHRHIVRSIPIIRTLCEPVVFLGNFELVFLLSFFVLTQIRCHLDNFCCIHLVNSEQSVTFAHFFQYDKIFFIYCYIDPCNPFSILLKIHETKVKQHFDRYICVPHQYLQKILLEIMKLLTFYLYSFL